MRTGIWRHMGGSLLSLGRIIPLPTPQRIVTNASMVQSRALMNNILTHKLVNSANNTHEKDVIVAGRKNIYLKSTVLILRVVILIVLI